MNFFVIPRRVARLQYMTARLPFTVLDKYVVTRYWDEPSLPRLSLRLFLGSMDELAGILLADDHIARRGQALMRGTEFPAEASEPETMVQARWAQYEENLQAAQAATRQAGEQVHEGIKIAAAGQQARRQGAAQAEAEKAPAEHASETRAAEAEQAPQAAQIPISAGQDRVSAAASQQTPEAADNRRLVRYRPEEAAAPASSS